MSYGYRNRVHLEGSIAETYTVNEVLTFCFFFFRCIKTQFNCRGRNNDI